MGRSFRRKPYWAFEVSRSLENRSRQKPDATQSAFRRKPYRIFMVLEDMKIVRNRNPTQRGEVSEGSALGIRGLRKNTVSLYHLCREQKPPFVRHAVSAPNGSGCFPYIHRKRLAVIRSRHPMATRVCQTPVRYARSFGAVRIHVTP